MNRILAALAMLLFVASAHANELASVYDEAEPDPRFFAINNQTSLSLDVAPLILGLLALGLLAALLAYFLLGSGGEETGYSGYSGDSGSSHSSYGSARAADPYSGIWNNMSVLDWIAMGEELYSKFDATNTECQQRLVCELHQNENSWGNTARKMNDAFSYLQYLELLNLPSEVRLVVDEYLDAANKGRTSQTGCDQIFSGCEFSVKNIINKHSSNSI